jgi:YVTN family beta-propeller protein
MRTSLLRCFFAGLAFALCLVTPVPSKPADTAGDPKPQLRRPVALVLADKDQRLFVANQRSGSVTVIDTASLRPVAEAAVGRRLADLTAAPDGRHLLAVDEAAHQLVVLTRHDTSVRVVRRLEVAPVPVSVRVEDDGTACTVASFWSRRLTRLELQPDGDGLSVRVARTVDLPFAPRRQVLLDGGKKVLVADAFGGQLAVVDPVGGAVESVRELPAHNVRGLAVSPDGRRVLLTHQHLNRLAQTTFDDVHWGNVLTNNLRSLSLDGVLQPGADLLRDSRLHYLGDVGYAAGDPAGLAVAADGQVLVALAGVNEISFGREGDASWRRLAVGRRPTAVAASADGRRAYVANTFGDSVSVIDLAAGKVETEIPLGPQPELSASDRGELLFYNAKLTHDGWFSCHSCHSDGHTNGRLNDNLGDGSFGAPKRVLTLLGVGATEPWAWNGSQADLAAQVRKSILTTMRGKPPAEEQVQDLVAFLRTLEPPPSAARLTGRLDEAAVQRGRQVFEARSCGTCHTPPAYTSRKTYDVGLTDEVGNRQFNPPSLRGVGQAGPYFHDGRASTLEEVFTRHRHQLSEDLPNQELADLLAFLRSL